MRIGHFFDGANINVIDSSQSDNIRLSINKDEGGEFFQWFNFRFEGEVGAVYRFVIENAHQASYPEGWEDYQAVASYDREHWFRLPTQYVDGQLLIEAELEHQAIQIAYFTPYSYERYLDLLSLTQTHPMVDLRFLGKTLDGRDMSLLAIGDLDSDKKNIWITARQHPGETMASWWIEGFLNALLDHSDPNARTLLSKANLYVVGHMNPDGGVRGHLRTNAKGVNLNREWQNPSMQSSPEVFLVREQMLKTGVDLFLDVHGDEALPYVFMAGPEGVPRYDEAMDERQGQFAAILETINSDFQQCYGYDVPAPGEANLTVATNWVAETFGCLANTLEMPFKDNANLPDIVNGWSSERCELLGRDYVKAFNAIIDAC